MKDNREQFSSSFGLIAAAVGSAVGLGNIWRFPYIVGEYGGAAFLIIYILLVALIGLPIMITEFVIGREGRSDAVNSFKNLAPNKKWHISGFIGVLASFFILSFYGVIAGWSLQYMFIAITNGFTGKSSPELTHMFTTFMSDPIKPLIPQIITMAITGFIVSTGIEKGVEKAAKFLIPILVILLLILNIYSFTLPGGKAGFDFLFKPDFSKLSGEAILAALGHAFFSLSLGMAVMITYGSYISGKENLVKNAVIISVADTLLALMSGIAIFPAVFAFGIEPSSGPGLVFMSLPNVFGEMTGGYIFGILFFALLFLAALTSTISILEAVVAYVVDNFKIERRKSAILCTIAVSTVGVIASLSNGSVLGHIQIAGQNIFDFLDSTTANYFLTSSALISVIYIGWAMDPKIVEKQLTNDGTIQMGGFIKVFRFLTKYIVPVGIILVFLFNIGIFG